MSVTESRTEKPLGDGPLKDGPLKDGPGGDGLEAQPQARGHIEPDRLAVKRRRVGRAERRWWGRRLVSLFILWHLFALAVWLVPGQSTTGGNTPLVGLFAPVVRPYMRATAFAQSWNMFAPNPDKTDVYLEARIAYADGERRSWFFPRMAQMGFARRYQEERWRKMVEVATHGNALAVGPALAHYAARVNYADAQNPPVSVELVQHTRTVPPPGHPMPSYAEIPLMPAPNAVLPIRPEDLR